MAKRGRPRVKKSEFKKVFPMRFSDLELRAFEATAGDTPLREWMRQTLLAAVPQSVLFKAGLRAVADYARQTGNDRIAIPLSDTGATPSKSRLSQ